jgi:hypothetical protein
MDLYRLHNADTQRSTGKVYVDALRVLVGKPEVKRPLGRPRHRCDELKK